MRDFSCILLMCPRRWQGRLMCIGGHELQSGYGSSSTVLVSAGWGASVVVALLFSASVALKDQSTSDSPTEWTLAVCVLAPGGLGACVDALRLRLGVAGA